MSTLPTLSRCTLALCKEIQHLEDQIARLRACHPIFEAIYPELETLDPIRLDVTAFDGALNLGLVGDRAKLNKAWNILRTHGFEAPVNRPEVGATEWSGYFNRLPARVYVHFTSTQCVRRQIGTKMVETPVYTTVCLDNALESSPKELLE